MDSNALEHGTRLGFHRVDDDVIVFLGVYIL